MCGRRPGRSGTCASKSSNSSDSPSEKYSWSFFSLISTKGSTAMDFSGIAAGGVADEDPVVAIAGVVAGKPGRMGASIAAFGRIRSYTTPARARTAMAVPMSKPRFPRRAVAVVRPGCGKRAEECSADGAEGIGAVDAEIGDAIVAATEARIFSDPRRLRTCSTNAGGAAPKGSRDHCTRTKDSGTSEPDSKVASTHTGTIRSWCAPFAGCVDRRVSIRAENSLPAAKL